MTDQRKRIYESADFLRSKIPGKVIPDLAFSTYKNPGFIKDFKAFWKIGYRDIPGFRSRSNESGEIILASHTGSKRKLLVLNGKINFFDGNAMRDAAHPVYVMKALGVRTLVFFEEVGYLNPRFETGGVALIYDHINLMGDNPLIGENDSTLGPRFPDMSDPYDDKLNKKVEKLFIGKGFGFYPSVYMGIPGPETETEAECRFYRDTGADVLGYNLVPENLAAVHSGIKCIAFGMMSRELVADRFRETDESEKKENRTRAEKKLSGSLKDIIGLI